MSSIEWHGVIIPILMLYLLCSLFNVGTVLAYLTRHSIRPVWSLQDLLKMGMIVLLSGLFGPFCLTASLSATSFPDYGWKLWLGEIPSPDNKWFLLLLDVHERKAREDLTRKRNGEATGNCESIWE